MRKDINFPSCVFGRREGIIFYWQVTCMPDGSWTHDLTLLLELIRGGGASWARAHWLEGVEKLEHGT